MDQSEFARFKPEDFAVIEVGDGDNRATLVDRIIIASDNCSKPVHVQLPQGRVVTPIFGDMMTGEIATKVGGCLYQSTHDGRGAQYLLKSDSR